MMPPTIVIRLSILHAYPITLQFPPRSQSIVQTPSSGPLATATKPIAIATKTGSGPGRRWGSSACSLRGNFPEASSPRPLVPVLQTGCPMLVVAHSLQDRSALFAFCHSSALHSSTSTADTDGGWNRQRLPPKSLHTS